MATDPLHNQRVAILGFARQGKALARWLPTVGAHVRVSDDKSASQLNLNPDEYPGVEFMLGGQPENFLDGVEVLCVSGGVPLELPSVQDAVRRRIRITNDAQLFLERCPAPVLGITGSAGKTTTTTLTGEIVKRAGFATWVGGNIGDVLLDVLPQIQPDHRVVMELSSFQLELMTVSPTVGAILNVTPNHLDRHGTMEAYIEAKAHIITHQRAGDTAVLGRDDFNSRELEQRAPGRVVWFSGSEIVSDGAFLIGSRLALAGAASPDGEVHIFAERDDLQLRGAHNILNVLAACAISGVAGCPPDAMRAAIRDFRGVAHRLEVVRVLDGVTYINDSIATAPERVVAALRSFDEPLILLLGGKDKDLPWDEVMALALTKARHIIAFGKPGAKAVAEIVERYAADMGAPDAVTRAEDLTAALAQARTLSQTGDVVLLSPGGTSFDAYPDFAARGEDFRRIVNEL
ncbi:MAG: UDP-N-acetylmuramoyl-L-alanine--D-glutamate ligase [Anaerolineae bacterium]|nr:UDP-N-acetylmuramoyl-L-alanine--D-glutamate ligase [Anaerolineae bacterium]